MSVDYDIKNGNISNLYLFYGKEAYKRRNYKDLLIKYAAGGNPQMNYNYFEGKDINFESVYDCAVTLPFFSDRRLVIIENSGLFSASKKAGQKSDSSDNKNTDVKADAPAEGKASFAEELIDNLPETTCLAFIEESVSKNKKLYKKVAGRGVVCECSADRDYDVKKWLAKGFNKAGKKVRERTLDLVVSMAGTDYDRLRCEYEKIIAYAGERDVIEDSDVLTVVSSDAESRIFSFVDAMALKQPEKLLSEYYSLLSNGEAPMYILAMIRRQFRIMLQAGEFYESGLGARDISVCLGMKEYPVKKALSYMKYFNTAAIEKNLDLIADTEYKIKSGDLADQTGVELLLLEFVMN